MGRTPDRRPGKQQEDDAVVFLDRGADPSEVGAVWNNADSLFGRDSDGVFNLRSLSEEQHLTLRHLIHFIDSGPADGFASGAFRETLPTGDPFPTSVIWYDDNTKTKKLVEKIIQRTTPGTVLAPTPITWKMYDTDGVTLLATVQDDITYTAGVFENDRTRTITRHGLTHTAGLDINITS